MRLAKRYSEKQFTKDMRAYDKSFILNHFRYLQEMEVLPDRLES